jgi:ribosomal protein S18 acetylase RimI-like enzyme
MRTIPTLTLRELRPAGLEQAAQIVGRAMCDNPVNVRAFAILDAERRCRALTRFFRPILRGLYQRGVIYGAYRDGALLGVCGIARPGFCRPPFLEKLSVVPSVLFGNPVDTTLRVLDWVREWERRDPDRLHWHLGPVAVDRSVQGQGIGSAMLTAFCAHMDAYGAFSYLETDRPENVRFYEKFGFMVGAEATVLGVPNWFMSRPGGLLPDAKPRAPDPESAASGWARPCGG